MKVIQTARFKATIEDVHVKIETPDGTFHIGVDNGGRAYLSTSIRPILIEPNASNRITIREDRS